MDIDTQGDTQNDTQGGLIFLNQILDLIQANGWEGQLLVEPLTQVAGSEAVRVKLSAEHPSAPLSLVNDYFEGLHPLEQVQQECLRALRTGRTGI